MGTVGLHPVQGIGLRTHRMTRSLFPLRVRVSGLPRAQESSVYTPLQVGLLHDTQAQKRSGAMARGRTRQAL